MSWPLPRIFCPLPSMHDGETNFSNFFFMVPKKRLFSCNKKVTPYVSRRLATVTIYTRRVVWFLTQKRLMVKVFQHHCVYLVRNPDTERRKAGKRPAPKRRSTREQERGEVREQQRLGLSQGTMIWEPRYGGGAHPKYRSCRVLVSQILRTEVWRGCTPEIPKL